MFYCETCRVQFGWPKGLRGFPYSRGTCEVCKRREDCFDVPADLLPVPQPEARETIPQCEVRGCQEPALKGRVLCNTCAYPAEQKKSGRRRAIEAQKLRKAKAKGAEE
jgi:hypothetical protein